MTHSHVAMIGEDEQIRRGVDQVTLSVNGIRQMVIVGQRSMKQESLKEALDRARHLYKAHEYETQQLSLIRQLFFFST